MTQPEPSAPPVSEAPPTRGLGHNIVVLLGSQVTTWILSAILLVLVPHFISPEEVGQLRISQSLWAIVIVLVTFGTANYLTIEVARNHQVVRALNSAVIRARFALFVVAIPMVAVFVWLAGYNRTLVILIAVVGFGMLISLVSSSDRAVLYGLEQMGAVARVDVLTEVGRSLLFIAVLIAGGGPIPLSVVGGGMFLFAAVMFRRGVHRLPRPAVDEPSRSGVSLLRACAPFLFADAAITVYLQVDTLVISLIASEEEIGWYATADVIFGSLLFVPAVLMNAVFPRMARIHGENPQELKDHVLQAFCTMMIVAVWIGLSTLVVSEPLTELVFNSSYSGTAAVLGVFGLVTILAYQTILLGQYAVASDRARWVGFVVLGSAILSIPLDLWLVRWSHDRYGNGAIGAGLAYIGTEGLQIIAGLTVLAPHLVCRRTGLRTARCVVAGLAMLAASWPLRSSFFLSGIVATVVYFFVLWLLRTPDEFERETMRRLARSVSGKIGRRSKAHASPRMSPSR